VGAEKVGGRDAPNILSSVPLHFKNNSPFQNLYETRADEAYNQFTYEYEWICSMWDDQKLTVA
jgi:hypothetical protein